MTLISDDLYACGPVIMKYREYWWDYMIVLKEDALQDVWKEAAGLMCLEPANSQYAHWGDQKQDYLWANDIEYEYWKHSCHIVMLNVVLCYETGRGITVSTGMVEGKKTRYARGSSNPLNSRNVFQRCARMARCRWKIESHFLIEKHEGNSFENVYSYDWHAMKGFHYLMKIGYFMNIMGE